MCYADLASVQVFQIYPIFDAKDAKDVKSNPRRYIREVVEDEIGGDVVALRAQHLTDQNTILNLVENSYYVGIWETDDKYGIVYGCLLIDLTRYITKMVEYGRTVKEILLDLKHHAQIDRHSFDLAISWIRENHHTLFNMVMVEDQPGIMCLQQVKPEPPSEEDFDVEPPEYDFPQFEI